MKNVFSISLLLFGVIASSFGQNSPNKTKQHIIRCASDEYNKTLLREYPNMMGSKAFEDKLQKLIKLHKAQRFTQTKRATSVLTIPVVVHVFHNGEDVGVEPNITDAQIESQITVLNEDYRKMIGTPGYNTDPNGADVEIEFCLARQTPSGCPTNGIDRVDIGQNGIVETSESDAYAQMDAFKPSTIWDPSQYLNIWIVSFRGDSGILGYAQFPGGSTNTDGVVINYKYFGSIDYDDGSFVLNAPYNKGRTTTHEIGHFLGLYHTFQGGCAGGENSTSGDYCADTPAVSDANYGCPTGTDSCPTPAGKPDMIENYMDYTDDACMNIFTNDQKSRIITTMTSSTNRKELPISSVCNPPASVNYDGSILIEGINLTNCENIAPKVRLTNYGSTTLTSATISYDLDGNSLPNYNWTGSLTYGNYTIITLPTQSVSLGNHNFNVSVSNPNGNTDARGCNDTAYLNFDTAINIAATSQIHLTITPDNYGSEITWEFSDGSTTLTGGPYTDGNTDPITQSFNVSSNACYSFKIMDAAGDGICCSYGTGSYSLKDDSDNTIVSGASYGNSEITNISTATLGLDEYFQNKNVRIFPNPTANTLTIKLSTGNDLPDSYTIYSLLGQTLKSKKLNHASDLKIDVSNFPNGFYFIKIIKEGNSISIPFIKK